MSPYWYSNWINKQRRNKSSWQKNCKNERYGKSSTVLHSHTAQILKAVGSKWSYRETGILQCLKVYHPKFIKHCAKFQIWQQIIWCSSLQKVELNPLPSTEAGHDYLLLTEYRKSKVVITLWRKLSNMTLTKWSKCKSHWHHVSLKWRNDAKKREHHLYAILPQIHNLSLIWKKKKSGQYKEREVPWDSWALLTKNVKVTKKQGKPKK